MNIWAFLTKSILNFFVWRISKWAMSSMFVIFDCNSSEPGSDLTAIFQMTPVGVDGPFLEEMSLEAGLALVLLK